MSPLFLEDIDVNHAFAIFAVPLCIPWNWHCVFHLRCKQCSPRSLQQVPAAETVWWLWLWQKLCLPFSASWSCPSKSSPAFIRLLGPKCDIIISKVIKLGPTKGLGGILWWLNWHDHAGIHEQARVLHMIGHYLLHSPVFVVLTNMQYYRQNVPHICVWLWHLGVTILLTKESTPNISTQNLLPYGMHSWWLCMMVAYSCIMVNFM